MRDESDRDGMRVVVEVKRGSSAAVRLTLTLTLLLQLWSRSALPLKAKAARFAHDGYMRARDQALERSLSAWAAACLALQPAQRGRGLGFKP